MAAEKQFQQRGQIRVYMEQSDIEAFKKAVKNKTGRSSAMSEEMRLMALDYTRKHGK